MLSLPEQTISKLKKLLLRKQREVDKQLKEIDKDDPVFDDTIESTEPGTESWQAEVHGRIITIKDDLLAFSKRIAESLLRLNRGTYGSCERCGQEIEPARLEAMPTATLCVKCSKSKTPLPRRLAKL